MPTGPRGMSRRVRRGARCALAVLVGGTLALAAAPHAGAAEALSITLPQPVAEARALSLEESLRLATDRNLRLQSARQEAAELAEEVPKAYKDFLPRLRGEARYFLQAPRPAFTIPQGTSATVFTGPPFPITNSRVLEDVDIVAGQRTDYNFRLRL